MSIDNDTTLHCIYRIVNFKNGKSYIGQTKNPEERKQNHFKMLRKGLHGNRILQSAFDRYGESSFYFEILESDVKSCDIDKREIDWIATTKADHALYNIATGGKNVSGNEKPCVWNGKVYRSIGDAANELGITSQSMSKRIKCGHICDDDLTQMIHNKSCSWNGIIYDTVTDAAKACGISKDAMSERLERGRTCDADITQKKRQCTWNGQLYQSVVDVARVCGVTSEAMIKRFKNGYTCDADIRPMSKSSQHTKVGIECVWNGKHYASIHAAARDLGIDANSMRKRLKRGHTCDADLDKRHQPRPR